MNQTLAWAVFLTGVGQLSVLVASALIPFQLDWRTTLAPLPKLVRQLFWVYGFYIVLSIVSLGLICIFNSNEIAAGSSLAKSFCVYVAAFWGIRLALQAFLDVKPYLTSPILRVGYHLLTVLFITFTAVMIWCAISS
jgi:hypothetical protein